jgi:hypothetical protein
LSLFLGERAKGFDLNRVPVRTLRTLPSKYYRRLKARSI